MYRQKQFATYVGGNPRFIAARNEESLGGLCFPYNISDRFAIMFASNQNRIFLAQSQDGQDDQLAV